MYTYVKGKGWVLGTPAPRAERVLNGRRIVLEKRAPKKGEYYWYWQYTPEKLLQTLNNYHFQEGTPLGDIAYHDGETGDRQTVVIVYHGPA